MALMGREKMGGLKTDGETVDPVSGNKVPLGSNADEVRDDIPAQLSDGEYVVPADVVRFFGVSFFEKLRTKAKKGIEEMGEDGRINGEPIEDASMQAELQILVNLQNQDHLQQHLINQFLKVKLLL